MISELSASKVLSEADPEALSLFAPQAVRNSAAQATANILFFILTSVTPLNSQGSSHWRQELHLNISYPLLPP